LPPADLFHQFQTASRIFYVTGDDDQGPLDEARVSARSLNEFCVANVTAMTMRHTAHSTADHDMLSDVLDALLGSAPSQPDDMTACRVKLDSTVQSQLQQVETLIADGDKAGARQLLDTIDAKYGGLAAPKSVPLDAEIH
jgi:hypothetical protein